MTLMTVSNDIGVLYLQDGQQQPGDVMGDLSAFLSAATSSLDIAVYDCVFDGPLSETLRNVLTSCNERGVAIRVAYFGGPHRAVTVPPAAGTTGDFVASLGVPCKAVTGYASLMHDKYVVRDADSSAAAVWTGSMNWTNDSLAREENVAVSLVSRELAHLYSLDFSELWTSGNVENTGKRDGGTATLTFHDVPAEVTVWFSPGQGEEMAHAVAQDIAGATTRIFIASPVLTVGSILGALKDVITAGRVPVRGVVDATQMAQVIRQWSADPRAAWKVDVYNTVAGAGQFAGKRSTPYGHGTVHDYMHAKIIVADNVAFVGSYNFSHSGEENAENLLRIENAPFADSCVAFIKSVIHRYSPAG